MFEIRRAKEEDFEAILRVLEPWNMHHIPSIEMESLELDKCFVAVKESEIIGMAGFKLLDKTTGKTTLLAVYPEFQGSGLGKALHVKRLEAMAELGVKSVITNSDRPEVITWYQKHFGYKEVGKVKKLCSFGLESVTHWTTLEMDLALYIQNREARSSFREAYINEHDAHPLKPYSPLIINVCLTGMIPTKRLTPYVPISIDEIIEDAVNVYDAGASIVHLHARDEQGYPTPDARIYEKIISGIRKERPDMICCATTSGRGWSDFERRSEVLHLTGNAKPDMASLTLGSLNFITGASVNTIDMIERLAMMMQEKGIKPELEVFDSGMINIAKYMERHGILSERNYFNLLLGNLNTSAPTIGHLAGLVNDLPTDSIWAGAGLGSFQLPMNMAAIIAGGHVRVGLEDNIYYNNNKTQLTTNEELVKRITRVANECGRKIAKAKEAREIIGL